MSPYILVVDDEPDIRDLVKDILQDEGYEVSVAENGETARQLLHLRHPDLVLLDIWMPDTDGISLLKEFIESGLSSPVVMISGHGTVETAVEATRLGAYDFIEKPLSLGKLLVTVQSALEAGKSQTEKQKPRLQAIQIVEPIGKSIIMQRLREQIKRIANFDSWLLIHGEPGSGKELFARYLHTSSQFCNSPFLVARIASMMEDNIDVLLFGREQQDESYQGIFEQVKNGSLYLDDISELDLPIQAKLCDVLANRKFKRVNGSNWIDLKARVISATRRNMTSAIKTGRFREDLYYQLNQVPLSIPPLREHCEDVPDLLTYFVDVFVNNEKLPYRKFSVAAQNWLRNYHWPGNVIELRSLVQRLMILGDGSEISVNEVGEALRQRSYGYIDEMPNDFNSPLRQARERFEKSYLEYHLKQEGGNVGMVAKRAGMERTHLYRKFRLLGIDPKQVK